jgi:hypothetical protein
MNAVFEVKDLTGITEEVLTQAIDYSARKAQLGDAQIAVDRIREGDGRVCEYCNYSLAKQVAASLGELDENVTAAYLYDYDAPDEEFCSEKLGQALPIHLIVQAKRKTAALNAVVETWDRALTQRYMEVIGGHRPAHLLDVQVVDTTDVAKRIGYGAMLSSIHHPPTEVWKRQ